MKKPELLVTPKNSEEIKTLLNAGADAFILGNAEFQSRGRGDFSFQDMAEGARMIHEQGKKVYLAIDAIMDNDMVNKLRASLKDFCELKIDAIRVADLGAYMIVREMMPGTDVHFSDAMMLTNHVTANYWINKGATRTTLAPEITLEDVLQIKKEATGEVEILIHGASFMFTSRRRLIENYLTFQKEFGKEITLVESGNMLYDEERHLYYPIWENKHGTHILSGSDVCMIDDLSELIDVGVDSFRIDSIADGEHLEKLVSFYKVAVDLCISDRSKYEKARSVLHQEVAKLQMKNRPLDKGFYYKPTIYKVNSDRIEAARREGALGYKNQTK